MCRAGPPSWVRGPKLRLSVLSRAIGCLLFFLRRGFRDDGIFRCSTTELHGAEPWQESNLRPSDYEVTLVFATGEISCTSNRRGISEAVPALLPARDRSPTARSNRNLSPPAKLLIPGL